ncbi:unnamed protein product, partial [marine sediment metagenome]
MRPTDGRPPEEDTNEQAAEKKVIRLWHKSTWGARVD